MKKILIFMMMACMPMSVVAQAAGGQITRKQTTTSTTAKKTQGSAASKKTNSGKRSTTPGSPSRRAGTGMTQTEKDRIIQNLINNMVYVQGGTFMMGATSEQGSDAYGDEKPAHQVTLSAFSIGRYEVTQEEWQTVMGSNPSNFKGVKRPVDNVSWNDCQEFIRKLNGQGYKYSGSNNLNSVAWYADNSGNTTHDVGLKSPNELGIYDMSGNVWEWCSDWYGNYSSSSQTNPTGSYSGSIRVSRGGSWYSDARYCRVSTRSNFTPDRRYISLGLRLAQ